jgi:formate hydrogenlyase transcriptional activator
LKQRQEEPENDLKAAERRQIIKVLKECRGRISGAKGAAARLGLNRTTLYSRLQRLGISRRDYTEQSQPEDD